MNFPFKFSCDYNPSDDPVVKMFFDDTDNLVLADIISANVTGHKLPDFSIVAPAGSFWLTSFHVECDEAAQVEFGIWNGTDTFLSLYPVLATQFVGGHSWRAFDVSGPAVLHDGTDWFAALRVTGASEGTIVVVGDIGVQPRG